MSHAKVMSTIQLPSYSWKVEAINCIEKTSIELEPTSQLTPSVHNIIRCFSPQEITLMSEGLIIDSSRILGVDVFTLSSIDSLQIGIEYKVKTTGTL